MEIEIRTEKIWFVRSGKTRFYADCDKCGGQMLTTDEAVNYTGSGSRTIFQMVESGQLHFRETPKGLLLVCPASLSQNMEKTQKE